MSILTNSPCPLAFVVLGLNLGLSGATFLGNGSTMRIQCGVWYECMQLTVSIWIVQ